MNINRIGRAYEIYSGNGYRKQAEKIDGLKKRDELKISSEAKLHQLAMAELKNVPDIREDKVAAIKARVEAGTYEIDAEAIASKMLQSAKGL